MQRLDLIQNIWIAALSGLGLSAFGRQHAAASAEAALAELQRRLGSRLIGPRELPSGAM